MSTSKQLLLLVQERHNSSALAMELCISGTNQKIWATWIHECIFVNKSLSEGWNHINLTQKKVEIITLIEQAIALPVLLSHLIYMYKQI